MLSNTNRLEALIKPAVEAFQLILWGIQLFSHDSKTILRVYIDKANGVGLRDCEKVSLQISAVLDVEDAISGEYTLEVSSPGIERPLFTLAQYESNTGQSASIKLRLAFEGKKKFKGIISKVALDSKEIHLICDDHEYMFPFDSIEKANIVANI